MLVALPVIVTSVGGAQTNFDPLRLVTVTDGAYGLTVSYHETASAAPLAPFK